MLELLRQRKFRLLLLALASFALLIIGLRLAGFEPLRLLAWLYQTALAHPWLMLLAFLLRPLILFPVSLLVVLSGALLGFWPGLALGWIGHVLTGVSAYALLRLLPRPPADEDRAVKAWHQQLQEHSFSAVLLLRVTLMPYDAVNFACAWLRTPVVPFTLATALGTIPVTVALVSFGASVQLAALFSGEANLSLDQLFNPRQLVFSVALVAASLGLAHWLKRRRKNLE